MRLRMALGLLLVLTLASGALASPSARIDGERTCVPTQPAALGGACRLSQEGTLDVVCSGPCVLVASGSVAATDAHPAKTLVVVLNIERSLSVTGTCRAAGAGTTTCPLDLRAPLLLRSDSCARVTLTTEYQRLPLSPVQLSRAYSVCVAADGAHSVTAL